MSLLLDTCALLALSRGELPEPVVDVLRVAPEAFVSSVSAWEIAIKVDSKKLLLPSEPALWFSDVLARHQLREIPIDSRLACKAAALPPIHRDPFDRILIAQAQLRELTILTSDKTIPRYPGIRTLW